MCGFETHSMLLNWLLLIRWFTDWETINVIEQRKVLLLCSLLANCSRNIYEY